MNFHHSKKLDLKLLCHESMNWLFEDALPIWFKSGIDSANGGFHDLLDVHTGKPVFGLKRSFVQARQTYVFAESAKLGWSGPWQHAVEAGLAALEDQFKHSAWGYLHNFGGPHVKVETKRDLYDQAFVAFAMSTASHVQSKDQKSINCLQASARKLLNNIDQHWSVSSGGYLEGDMRAKLPRRQNPHMHLFEASIELALASGNAADLEHANLIAKFAATRLINPDYPMLPEYFTSDWEPTGKDGKITLEPGHHFEWAWLFCRLANAGGDDYRPLAEMLWRFANDYGVDDDSDVAIAEIEPDGTVISSVARLWPQAERLKAALAMMEFGVASAEEHAFRALTSLNKYLQVSTPGLYFDKLKDDGTFVNEPARASSMYHIVCAFSELTRVVNGNTSSYKTRGL